MKKINEALINDLQRLTSRPGELEINMYDALIKGRIIMRNGRIKSADCGNRTGRAAVEKVILNESLKYTIRELSDEYSNYVEDIDYDPAEVIIPLLLNNESKYSSFAGDEDTKVLSSSSNNQDDASLQHYDVILERRNRAGQLEKEYYLKQGRNLIGRLDGCHVCLQRCSVSRVHAVITVRSGAVYVQDLQTINGTQVNGKAIRANLEIYDEDQLNIGGTTLILSLRLKIRRNRNTDSEPWRGMPDTFGSVATQAIHFEKTESERTETKKLQDILKTLFGGTGERKQSIGVVRGVEVS